MLKKIYLSPFGYIISIIQHIVSFIHQPFMVYGFYNNVQKKFMKLSRVSSSTKIMSKKKFDLSDNTWIGHYNLIDASHGVKIGKGVQTGPFVSIFSHSSHISIRLLGESYLQSDERTGYVEGKVEVGDYSFIGTSCIIFPGVVIGKGCLIKAGSVVTNSMPSYSIVSGNPATVEGNVLDIDKKYFADDKIKKTYFDCKLFSNSINTQDIPRT